MSVDIADYVRETRAAQGLPPKVTDPATLARVSDLLRVATPAKNGGRR